MRMTTVKIVIVAALAAGATVAPHAQQGGARGAKAKPAYPEFNLMFKRGPLESKVVTGQPYSAEITNESIQTLSDGNRIVHRTTGRVYRDGQGRVRREDDQPSGTPAISITDPVANMTITIDTERKTANETPGLRLLSFYMLSPGFSTGYENYTLISPYFRALTETGGRGRNTAAGTPAAGARAGAARGTGRATGETPVEETLSNRTIEGVSATGIRRTTTIEKGAIGNEQAIKIVSEEWTSPDLQVLVLTDFNDPRAGRSTYKLTNIKRGEPDASLFKAPAGYNVQRTGGARGGRGRGGK
jgi:hypothetical protein